jgi:hypothetical protein
VVPVPPATDVAPVPAATVEAPIEVAPALILVVTAVVVAATAAVGVQNLDSSAMSFVGMARLGQMLR